MYRRLYLIGIVAYIIMLVFSVIFYKERIIILDTAFSLFHIVRTASFSIYASRCGALVTQILPVLAVKSGASLNIVGFCYSVGFTLFYFACYVLCGIVFKRYDFALVLLLFHILFVADTFYYIPSELPQGVNFLMVGFAAVSVIDRRNTVFYHLVLFGFLFSSAFFHPLVSFVILYSVLFFHFQKNTVFGKRTLILFFVVYIFGVFINNLFFRIDYDRHAMSGVKNFIKLFPDYFSLYSDRQFLRDCLRKYYWLPVCFAGITSLYIYRKEWKKLLLFISFFLGYLLLVNVSYPTDATPLVYMENQYLPLAIVLAYPIVFDLFPVLKSKKLGVSVLLLIMTTACFRFYTTHAKYTARLNWERKVLNEYAGLKVLIGAQKTDAEILQMLWGTPYEFWLLSTIEKDKTASIIIDENPAYRPWVVYQRKSFVVNWNIYPYDQLNPKYFHLTDTTSGYTIIK